MDNTKCASGAIKEILSFIPNLLKLVYRLSMDEAVSNGDRALLLGVISYVILPWDILPDFIPLLGQVDDMMLMALVLRRMMDSVDQFVVEQYWDGNENLLMVLQRIINFATDLLPPHIHNKLIKRSQE